MSSQSVNQRKQAEAERGRALMELEKYEGIPRCQDCGWKHGSDITKYCSCLSKNNNPEARARWQKAYNRARELQKIVERTNWIMNSPNMINQPPNTEKPANTDQQPPNSDPAPNQGPVETPPPAKHSRVEKYFCGWRYKCLLTGKVEWVMDYNKMHPTIRDAIKYAMDRRHLDGSPLELDDIRVYKYITIEQQVWAGGITPDNMCNTVL